MPKTRTTALLLCVLLTACTSPVRHIPPPPQTAGTEQKTSGNLIIFYDSQTGPAPLMQAVKDYGATLIYAYRTLRGIVIRPPQNVPLQDAAAHFEQVKGVLAVNQDQITPLY